MADDLVLARSKTTNRVAPMSRFLAERSGAVILKESPYAPDGSLKPMTAGEPVVGVDAAGDTKPYAKWKKADLEAEVESRNTGRADDDQIVVGGTGKVTDLAAALDADDEATASDTGDSEVDASGDDPQTGSTTDPKEQDQ